MFKNIIGTIGARYLVAFLNLLLIFINAKVLGREGIGLVGMIYASANLAVVFNSILCGNTIVYFMNRYGLRYVFWPAYIWAFVGSLIACFIMFLFRMLPAGYEISVFALAVLISLVASNSLILLGKDKVKGFNLTYIINGVLLFIMLLVIYFFAGEKSVIGYLVGLLSAFFVAFAFSFVLLIPILRKDSHTEKNKTKGNLSGIIIMKEMFLYGLWSSVDNLAEGLATRLNYFLVENIGGYSNVGLLDSGTKISESAWHISHSISYLEYNSVSKTTDIKEQKTVTLQLFKLTYCALILVMAVIICIPEFVFTEYLLTSEFVGIRNVIIAMSVGIIALGSNHILSHYFIGSGNIKYSAFCSIFGLVILLIAGYVLIPLFGVTGAALTSSIAYLGMLIFSIVVFKKQTKTRMSEFIPSKTDWTMLMSKLHSKNKDK